MKFFNDLAHQLRRNAETRRAIAELQSMTDRELNDIGVTRDTIRRAVLKGRN